MPPYEQLVLNKYPVKLTALYPSQISHTIHHQKLGFSRISKLGLGLGLLLIYLGKTQH